MEITIRVQPFTLESLSVAPGDIRSNMNRIDIGIWKLEAQIEADPRLILNEDLGVERYRFDHDMRSALTILSRTHRSLRKGSP